VHRASRIITRVHGAPPFLRVREDKMKKGGKKKEKKGKRERRNSPRARGNLRAV
jgi:hypothetical protein